MTIQISCSYSEDTLDLVLNGEVHSYPNDKSGKRQAILDGLGAIEIVSVGQDSYLPSSEALQVVAAILVFRVITYLFPIPFGAAAYVVWRRNESWRLDETERDRLGGDIYDSV